MCDVMCQPDSTPKSRRETLITCSVLIALVFALFFGFLSLQSTPKQYTQILTQVNSLETQGSRYKNTLHDYLRDGKISRWESYQLNNISKDANRQYRVRQLKAITTNS